MVIDNQDDDLESTQNSETNDSRRRFLAGSAGAIGALTLGSAFGAQSALAEDDTETETPVEGMFEDDVAILNYALTLEYLEAAFYRRALDNIDEGDVIIEWVEEPSESVRERIYEEITVIKEHEETHVEFLTGVISDLGGEPVEEPEFDFGSAIEDPQTFIETAAVLEDTGVAAYAGAAPEIEDESLVPPALSIHSVEARHASFVRELGGMIGFPDAFDEPLPKSEVLDRASQFIVSEMPMTETDDGEATETATEGEDEETETATDDGEATETATDDTETATDEG